MKALSHAFLLLILSPMSWPHESTDTLAVIDAGVQRAEDSPYISKDFQFLPGEYLYFTFHVSGFAAKLNEKKETKSLDLNYEITPEDANHVPLAEPVKGSITEELGKEDKNWIPKRRVSFLLPSFVAAGQFDVHVVARDLVAKTETARDFPFQIGGIHIPGASSIQAASFEFLRKSDDAAALALAAYAPGDTVYARFQMVGFRYADGNKYKLSYGLKVLRPDGKAFLDEPNAAQISAENFYPAQYVPGELQITTPKNASRGTYQVTLTVRDEIANQTSALKQSFTIE